MSDINWDLDSSTGAMFQPGQLQELMKALTAGSDINNPGATPGGGFAIRAESLDDTVKVLIHQESDLVAWRDFPKKKADNVIQEFMQLRSVGWEGGVFNQEGELPSEDDSTWARLYTTMKYMGVTKRVSHVMSVLGSIKLPEGVVAAEAKNGALKLLRAIELNLWDGDETACVSEFHGFFRKFIDGVMQYANGAGNVAGSTAYHTDIDTVLATDLLQDMRYEAVSQDAASDLTTYVADTPNYGNTTDIYYPYATHKDFSKQFYPKMRGEGLVYEGRAGVVVNSWASPFGTQALKPAKFLKLSGLANQLGEGSALQRPAAPTIGGAGLLSPVLAGALPGFHGTTQSRTAPTAVDGAGTYTYQIVACNRFGKSAPLSTGGVVVSVGDMVTIPIVDGSPSGVTEWYDVYRSLPGGAATTAKFIFRSKRTGVTQTITDFNRFIPGTGRAFFVQRDLQSFAWYQLLPMLKMNLAQIDPTLRFCLLMYGALEIFAPRKQGVMINIGPLV